MAQFVPGSDQQVTADGDSTLEVLVDQQHLLKVGKHTFQLVVTDDSGLDSEPALVTIIVQDTRKPTAVIDVLDAAGRAVAPPFRIGVGDRFVLSGKRSTDIGGTVKRWTWTLLPD